MRALISSNGVFRANVVPDTFLSGVPPIQDCHPTPQQLNQQNPLWKLFPLASWEASRYKGGLTPAIHTSAPARPGLKSFESLFVIRKKGPYSGKLAGTIILLAISLVI